MFDVKHPVNFAVCRQAELEYDLLSKSHFFSMASVNLIANLFWIIKFVYLVRHVRSYIPTVNS